MKIYTLTLNPAYDIHAWTESFLPCHENLAHITSREAGDIVLSPEVEKAVDELRSFMFERVYRNPIAKGEESKAKEMLQRLFAYYISHPEALPEDFHPQLSFDGMERTVCDYIAGMTDNYAVDKYTQIFIPMGWQTKG